jgi:hypothetical protein
MMPVVQRGKAVKNKTLRLLRAAPVCAAIAALLFAIPAGAQLYAPVAIGTPNPVTDEFGTNLQGSAMGPSSESDLVQVLWATNGIEPPDYFGTPNPNNPPVAGGASHVGNLTAPDLVNAGLFSVSLVDPRPPNNSKIFVRVFNAPKRRDATFYADSQVLTVRDNNLLLLDLRATTNAVDLRDDDNDRLNNSWERSLGTDLNNPDCDGDGMIDGDEFKAGTGILDENSVFVAVQITPDANGNAAVAWDSVVGKSYQIECMDGPWADPVCYTNVSDVITATDVVTETTITNGLLGGMGKFRVRLVEP